MLLELIPTSCPICSSKNRAQQICPANFQAKDLNPSIFSARRIPDGLHHRLVRCQSCGLVRADPVISPDLLTRLYRESNFNYSEETANLQKTYGRYLARLRRFRPPAGTLLEIGCGNGFFLETALRTGYHPVWGVEPSQDAVAKANKNIQGSIICAPFQPGLFSEETFTTVCFFHVLDHLIQPEKIIREVFQILKPGGLVLCIVHNLKAISARLLKKYSPIFDLEHTFLFSPETIKKLFQQNGFQIKEIGPVLNTYSIYYLLRLLPAPARIKNFFLQLAKKSAVFQFIITLPLGNLFLIAQKPSPNV